MIILIRDKSMEQEVKSLLIRDISIYGGRLKTEYKLKPAIAASLPVAVIQRLRSNPNIRIVDDLPVYTLDERLDWGVARIEADIIHPVNRGRGVRVAIMDTGIDYTHPDLAANYRGGYDFGGDYPGAPNDADPMDTYGHGTHCAGVVGAIAGNGEGVIGVAPEVDLYAVKVFPDRSGVGNYSDVIEGLEWCIDTHYDDVPDNDIQVISMSFGSDISEGDPGIEDWIDAAYNAGILLVAAAGNGGPGNDTVIYPARYKNVIAVGATDKNDEIAWFSSTGPSMELVAPGVSIYSTVRGGRYAYMSGTSTSCPMVSGTAALIWAAYPWYDNNRVRERLANTARDLGAPGRDERYGYGLVDAGEAGSPPAMPVVASIEITPDDVPSEDGIQIEPEPGGNRSVTLSAVVRDADGCDDVTEVVAMIEGPDVVSDSPVVLSMVSRDDATGRAIFTGRFNMSFYYRSGEYRVNVTAVDKEGLRGYNSTSIFYLTAIGLALDTDMVTFGSLYPGEGCEVEGDDDMSTPACPTVWNIGNVAIDIEVNGTSMHGAAGGSSGSDSGSGGGGVIAGDALAVRIGDDGDYKELGCTRLFYVNIPPDGRDGVYFRLLVPRGTPSGNYTGGVSLRAVKHT